MSVTRRDVIKLMDSWTRVARHTLTMSLLSSGIFVRIKPALHDDWSASGAGSGYFHWFKCGLMMRSTMICLSRDWLNTWSTSVVSLCDVGENVIATSVSVSVSRFTNFLLCADRRPPGHSEYCGLLDVSHHGLWSPFQRVCVCVCAYMYHNYCTSLTTI